MTAMTKIMILEDSIDSLKALKAIVESISKDIAVIPVKSLEEARAALQDEANLFQAFLLDINLDEQRPQDASGIEFAREVRNDSRYVFTPVIMITSLASLELAAYRELHCYQYILKPYQREEIEKLIRKVLFQTGDRVVTFESKDAAHPAKFYFNSLTAHRNYPDRKVTKADAVVAEMGSLEGSNHRNINKMLVNQVLPTCQLQMGMTELAPGSVWNTMPAHVHSRRMEAYFYFEIPEDHAICHFMGEVGETRHVWMKGDQAVLSPEWSIHSAAATHNYTFIWGMGGENLDYGDQDFSLITDLK